MPGMVCTPAGARQIFYHLPGDEIGYCGFSHVVRNYAAVTAAVVAGRRSVFRDIGAFDETLALDYNDIDFCLRAWSHGYRVVYTPFCELVHFENTSLARTVSHPHEIRLFQERWHAWAEYDPFLPVDVPGSGLAPALGQTPAAAAGT